MIFPRVSAGCFQLQCGNALEMPAILVAPRPVQQQVAHAAQFQPFQLRRALRAQRRARPAAAFARTGRIDTLPFVVDFRPAMKDKG